MKKPTLLLIDCQGLQTTSFNRGMGRYSLNLLHALKKRKLFSRFSKVVLLVNTKLEIKHVAEALEPMCSDSISIDSVPLPYKTASRETIITHKKILNKYIKANFPNHACTTMLLSIFELDQAISVFPDIGTKLLLFYDLIPLLFPNEFLNNSHVTDDYFYRFSQIFEANHIFSISQSTANDLVTYLNVSPSKVTNIRGASISHTSKSKKPSQYIPKPFFLFPSGENWRKNNEKTIQAFNLFNKGKQFSLVITSSFSEQTIKELKQYDRNIIFTQHITNSEMLWLYQNATAVIFPSLYEGLGLPILEAVEQNKPVLASEIDAFKEFTQDAFVWCNPESVRDIARAMESAITHNPDFNEYRKILEVFSWESTAETLEKSVLKLAKSQTLVKSTKKKKRVALVGPSPSGYSAIGKVCQELLPSLSENVDVDFYYEIPPGTPEFKKSYAPYVWDSFPVAELHRNVNSYDQIIYNIGNSEYHACTYLLALKYPDTVIVHDLDLSGLNNVLLRDHPEWTERAKLESQLESYFTATNPASNIISLINRQKKVITHNKYSYQRLLQLNYSKATVIRQTSLPIPPPIRIKKNNSKPIIAIAGLISLEKNGSQLIELIKKFHSIYQFIIFGYTFHDQAFLELSKLATKQYVELHHNVTDYEFNQLMKKADYLINLRPNYRGEASRTVLEALRYGVVPIVSNIGWFAELPDEIVIKVDNDSATYHLFERPTILAKTRNQKLVGVLSGYLRRCNYREYLANILEPN